MGDWLQRFHALDQETNPSPDRSDRSDRSDRGLSGANGPNGPGYFPPLDAEGVPCGGCPSCNQGEFWRWPKFHKDHDPTGWVCWFCSPPPHGSGPCDFCGVPEDNK